VDTSGKLQQLRGNLQQPPHRINIQQWIIVEEEEVVEVVNEVEVEEVLVLDMRVRRATTAHKVVGS
jgi:hypothetical protein